MTEKKRFNCHVKFSKMPNGIMVLDYEKHGDEQTVIEDINREKAHRVMDRLNELNDENEQLKSTIARLIEQNRKNNDLLLSDIRILEKALWCGGCENDYGRLKELRKEFIR